MDENCFDAFARAAGESASRRRVLRRLSALPLAGGLAAILHDDEGSAAKKKKRKKKCKSKAQVCADKCGTVTYKCKKKKRKVDCGSCLCDVCASGCDFTSVQAAIDAADPGDTIRLCGGTYTEDVDIDKDLTIVGIDILNVKPILHGTLSNSVITVSAGPVILQDLRITGGGHGGIYNEIVGTLEMTNCVISGNGNMESLGGGVRNKGTLTLTGSTVTENTARDGGGISNYATLALTGSTISENTAIDFGGGIDNDADGTLEMNDCTVTGNTTSFHGGGIFNAGMVALEAGTTVTDNDAEDGGGIFNEGLFGDATSTCSGGSSVSGNTPDNCVALSGGSCGGC